MRRSFVTIVLLNLIFISSAGTAQNNFENELSKRLEVEGLRLLIETKMLDQKMPQATGIPRQIWRSRFRENSIGSLIVIPALAAFVGSGIFVKSMWETGPGGNSPEAFLSIALGGLGSVGLAEASDSFKTPETEKIKAEGSNLANYKIDQAVKEVASQTALIFSLDSSQQETLANLLKIEALKQLEQQAKFSAKENEGIHINTLQVMFDNGLISGPAFTAAKEIGVLLAQNHVIKTPRKSLGYGERQLQNMINYLQDINARIDDRDVNSHVSSLIDEAQKELDFVKTQAH